VRFPDIVEDGLQACLGTGIANQALGHIDLA
jgi:hypothetical protein